MKILKFTTLAPLFFFVYLGNVLFLTHGHYNSEIVFILIGAFALTSVFVFRKTETLDDRTLNILASAIILQFSYLLLKNPGLIYAHPGFALGGIHSSVQLLCIAAAIRMLLSILPASTLRDHWLKRVDYVSLMLLFTSKIDVIFASPKPIIDVFTMLNEAIRYFSQGLNPYVQKYTELYAGRYDYQIHFSYWPAMLFILAPFKLILGDFRFAYIASDLVTCLALWKIGEKLNQSPFWKRSLLLLWLSFPVTFFVLEQAWTDPLLIAVGAWLLWACLESRWITAAVLMGLACSIKQYGFLMSWVSLTLITASLGYKTAARIAAQASAVFLLCLLPFILTDAGAFYDHTITLYQNLAVRRDALSLAPALLNRFNLELPSLFGIFSFPVLFAGITYKLFKSDGMTPRNWAGALFILYGFSFIFLGSAFCNHYYFIAFFALLWGNGLNAGKVEDSEFE